MITYQELKQKIQYNPKNGRLVWLTGPYKGKIAGSYHDSNKDYLKITMSYKGKTISLLAHRIAFLLYYKRWPKGVIHHINGDRSDNRIDNLQECNRKNLMHKELRKNRSSNYKYISYSENRKKWKCRIPAPNGDRIFLGYDDNIGNLIKKRNKIWFDLYQSKFN